MKPTLPLIALFAAVPAFAENARELDAHEHGVGTLNIAIEGTTVAMEFEAPGADIVGFEYIAENDADLAAIEAAVATLSVPLDLFVLPDAANCSLVTAIAELVGDDGHELKDEAHHDHDKEDHDDHGDNDHAEHEEENGHTEFHAEYTFNCDTPDALNEITFAYFEAFPNAQEVEVQIVSAAGAKAFEVERYAPELDLRR